MALTNKLSAIGDAIRAKTGKSEKLTLDSMVTEIDSITTGGGSGSDTLEKFLDRTLTSYSNSNLTSLPANAFSENATIRELNIPSVSVLGKNCFDNAKSLENLNLNWDEVQEFPAYCFNYCRKLQQNFPKTFPNITTVGDSFMQMMTPTELHFPKLRDASAWTAFSAGSGFNSKTRLIRIGAKCTFGYGCFDYHAALEALILESSELCIAQNSNLFKRDCAINNGGYNGKEGYIYVPKALVEQYKVATNWNVYAEKFRAIEDYPEICGGA